jgi:oligo-1,6-glucosidase
MKKQWWHNIPEEDYCYESATSLATASILLRGLPMLYQGQEIGMKNCTFHSIDEIDDISTLGQYQIALDAGLKLKEAFRSVLHCCRDHARTPVQWTAGENAGFTTATPG